MGSGICLICVAVEIEACDTNLRFLSSVVFCEQKRDHGNAEFFAAHYSTSQLQDANATLGCSSLCLTEVSEGNNGTCDLLGYVSVDLYDGLTVGRTAWVGGTLWPGHDRALLTHLVLQAPF
ncbi:BAAT / Acyl-CoA thioester hydrolase C terminal [Musa troglodytarum]|uniref:BAAT / Acyl-CoA thioester hydrolase C terminal n=1 Tax=Musa troglodytarum TaxID=320322 RepID=A0A9E7HG91_9LILI|nr:BAAT / Acyl-CoA thioester hydrolase C terminal [Musa troglodytarum]